LLPYRVSAALGVAAAGTQLDTWLCGSYGSCQAMASMLTSAALAQQAVYAPGLSHGGSSCGDNVGYYSPRAFAVATAAAAAGFASVPENSIGEQPRCSWRLVTGHDNGQLLIWSGASDRLMPLVKVGEPLGPVRAVTVFENQGLLAVARANGDVSLFLRPARDEDWVLPPVQLPAQQQQHQQLAVCARDDTADGAGPACCGSSDAGGSGNGSSCAGTAAGDNTQQQQQQQQQQVQQQAQLLEQQGLTAIKPRKVTLRSHRSQLACAAACAAGVATASSLGAIKLWSAEGLAREAERGGLMIKQPGVPQCALLGSSMGSSMDHSR
jgi:hypothetical protein